MSRRSPLALAAAALLGLFALQAATSIRSKSLTHDEDSHFTYGQQVLAERSFLRTIHRHNATSPWMALNAAAAATVDGDETGAVLSGERLRRARLATVVFGVALGVLVFAWAREAWGTAAGLLGLALVAFSPNLLAHTRLVTTDVVASAGILLALWTLWRLHRRRTALRVAATGLALGLALTTKGTALDLVPAFALLVAWRSVELWRARRGGAGEGDIDGAQPAWRPWADLGVAALLALFVLNALHLFEGSFSTLADFPARSRGVQAIAATPFLRELPLPLPAGWVQGIDWTAADLERGRWSYLLGEYSREGFASYYLVALLVKSTVGFLALAALAAALALARRPPAAVSTAPTARYLLLPATYLFLHLSLFHSFQIGLRHLLPVYPLLWIAVSAVAASPLRWARLTAWGLVTLHAASSLATHPHYLAYFNEPSGGPARGWRYLADSNIDWGQDRGYARRVWAPASLQPVIENPGAPTAGRLMVRVNDLVGLTPEEHSTYAWLRDQFSPVASIGHSWLVYDVTPEALAACCRDFDERLPEPVGGLRRVIGGRPLGGGDGIEVDGLDRLVDGHLGSGRRTDAASTKPLSHRPVEAWFGMEWEAPVAVSRLVAYPVLALRGPRAGRFQARTASFEIWGDDGWTRVATFREIDGPRLAVDLPAPISTQGVRLVVHAQRNHRGLPRLRGRFRAACLEISAYGPG